MRHLSHAELVDLVEGVLPTKRVAHVDACARCRAEGEALARVTTEMRSVEMPEPSPLFWQHLGAQIRDALDREPQPDTVDPLHARPRPGWRMLPAALALAAVVAAGLWWLAASRSSGLAETSAPHVVDSESPHPPALIKPASRDAGWELMLAIAEQHDPLDDEDLGIAIAPGTAERAVLDLAPDEQRELMGLLREAIENRAEPATGPT
ncbi:MAG: hypothetical protein GEU99_04955 [Luteitalea sp.]|nr:hypothetical protein [Luteitalea sp.]